MSGPYALISDIDGVLHRGKKVLPGARRFIHELTRSGRKFVFLTNSPDHSPQDLHRQLKKMGMEIPPEKFYTSARAIAEWLLRDNPHPRVHAISSPALVAELKHKGIHLTKDRPQFLIVTASSALDDRQLDEALHFIQQGARYISANNDLVGLTPDGIHPGNGALISPIEKATGCPPYIIGKPNHLMIRGAERHFDIVPEKAIMLGDNLATDIEVGLQAEMTTVLLLSGITSREDLKKSHFRPDYVFKNLASLHLSRLP